MKYLYSFFLGLLFFLLPQPVYAHAFGKLYNLPVPFWLYLYGSAAALIVSFAVIGYTINKTNTNSYYKKNLSKTFFSFLTRDWFIRLLKTFSFSLFVLTIISGLIGIDSTANNFNMTFFWVIFLLGLSYTTALIGNIWAIINPWKIITDWLKKYLKEDESTLKYPQWLGYYPALIFYFLLIYIELLGNPTPRSLSFFLALYTTFNILGVMFIGQSNWFKYCEFFSVFFRLIGKIAPFELTKGILYLRSPFIGLIKGKADHFSLVLFILFMLSSTAFDGFEVTVVWFKSYWEQIPREIVNLLGSEPYHTFQLINLLLSPVLFLVLYWLFLWLTKIVTKSKRTINDLSLEFAYSLVPIAFVYNVAHYYNLILYQGQDMIRLISDPFGYEWNIFRTSDYQINLSVIDAGVTWHVQVVLILFGHIAGVYIAHTKALVIFPSQMKALISQIPLLLIMVAFTMIGLWILAQPVTGGEY